MENRIFSISHYGNSYEVAANIRQRGGEMVFLIHSYFYGQENAGMAVLDRLDGIEKVMIGNSGHFFMNDNPDEFYPGLRTFLTS